MLVGSMPAARADHADGLCANLAAARPASGAGRGHRLPGRRGGIISAATAADTLAIPWACLARRSRSATRSVRPSAASRYLSWLWRLVRPRWGCSCWRPHGRLSGLRAAQDPATMARPTMAHRLTRSIRILRSLTSASGPVAADSAARDAVLLLGVGRPAPDLPAGDRATSWLTQSCSRPGDHAGRHRGLRDALPRSSDDRHGPRRLVVVALVGWQQCSSSRRWAHGSPAAWAQSGLGVWVAGMTRRLAS